MTDLEAKLRDHALAVWPGIDWTGAEVRVGGFHTVIIPPTGPILRVTTGSHFDIRAQREARTLQAMGTWSHLSTNSSDAAPKTVKTASARLPHRDCPASWRLGSSRTASGVTRT